MSHLAAMLPTQPVLDGWADMATVRTWAGVSEELLKSFVSELGEDDVPDMVVLSAVAVDDAKVAFRALELKPLKRTRLNLLLNALHQKFGMGLTDFTSATPEAPAAPSSTPAGSSEGSDILKLVDAVAKAAQAKPSGETVKVAHEPVSLEEVHSLR